ncbi:MAG: hypothetical protein AB8H47_04945 [Bacteroidia bacterium]
MSNVEVGLLWHWTFLLRAASRNAWVYPMMKLNMVYTSITFYIGYSVLDILHFLWLRFSRFTERSIEPTSKTKVMQRSLLFLIALSFLAMISPTIEPIPVELLPNATFEVRGDLSEGVVIDDLSWAWSSSNACFPATQRQKFTGNHVLYTANLPRYSELEVTVVPDDEKANFSIYAYEVGLNNDAVVPNLPSCIRCEADHKWDRNYKGKTQNHTRTVRDLIAINNPYKVVVGVVGAEGLQEGGYTLQFKLKSR